MKAYPKPDHSDFIPNKVKTPDNDTLDIGWSEGKLSDGRLYRMECWAQDQVTSVTFFFTIEDLPGGDRDWWAKFLEREGLVTFSGERFIGTDHFTDPSGHEIWSVNVVIGDEDQTYVSQTPEIFSYQ